MTRTTSKKRTRRRHWSRRSRSETGRTEWSGCVSGRTLERAVEEEEDGVLSFRLHRPLRTSRLLAFPEGVCSRKAALQNFFSWPAPDFLSARREAFVGKTGAAEVVW